MPVETFAPPEIVEEFSDPGSPHLARIRGRFISEGARSANKRIYRNVRGWIEKAQGKLDAGGVIDMRTHHGAGENAREITGRITKLSPDGTYEALVPNTPAGRTTLPLIRGGYLKHVSLRGANAVATPVESDAGWTAIEDLDLRGIDFTNNPGIAEASVVAESKDEELLLESFGLIDAEYWERDFSKDERDKAAGSGAALPDGSFPILTVQDLKNAIHAYGRAKNQAAAKAHIIKRAKALGATSELPDDWKTTESQGDDMPPKNATTDAIAGVIKEHIASANLPGEDATPEELRSFITERFHQAAEKTRALKESTDGAESVAEVLELAVRAAQAPVTETTTEPVTFESLIAEITEAGKKISSANMAKLKAAHDNIASATEMDCAPGKMKDVGQDGDGDERAESDGTDEHTESTDIKALLETAVSAAVSQATEQFQTKLEEQRTAYETQIGELKSVRRKSHAVLENTKPEQLEKEATLEDAVRAVLSERGISLR